jgi:Domain of unknown function (DUF6468)
MTSGIGIVIDGLVAILLILTIGYCILLNRRLKLLRADEQSLRATISELVTATEIAERAIGGLKLTVHECDMGLGERLRKAERVTIEIERTLVAGKDLLGRLSQIVTAGRGNDHAVAPLKETRRSDAKIDAMADAKADAKTGAKIDAETDAKALAAAAEAFAERLRTKVHGLAA